MNQRNIRARWGMPYQGTLEPPWISAAPTAGLAQLSVVATDILFEFERREMEGLSRGKSGLSASRAQVPITKPDRRA
jgi:hypothetical protein